MTFSIKLSNALIKDAKSYAAAEHRFVLIQTVYCARNGKAVTDNPEMSLRLIQDLISAQESHAPASALWPVAR